MNGYARTANFIRQEPVDRLPFHPMIMRFAARYADAPYRDFCLDYRTKCAAMLKCARELGIDWVTVMSDPYAEAQAFGMVVDYPHDDLPIPRNLPIGRPEDVAGWAIPEVDDHPRLLNRINEIRHYRELIGDDYFIVGWVEGPMACYANLRGFEKACLDLFEHPAAVTRAVDLFSRAAINFIDRQIEAGAHCIGIGDAVCSQIGPDLYARYGFPLEKKLVEFIQARGAVAKLHICGDTTAIMPMMIATGADIIDVDHAVTRIDRLAPLLAPHQVFSGNSDPVSVIQDGDPRSIGADVRNTRRAAGGRCIVSAGCEITPDTPLENVRAMGGAARRLGDV